MSGAWEIPGPQVLVGILTREVVSSAWAKAYRDMQLPTNSHVQMYAGMPFDHARNNACQDALTNGFQWVFFLDDDVVAPPDTVQRLINRNVPIVSGLYYRRHEGIQACMQMGPGEWVKDFQVGTVIEVGAVGAGCLLIHRSVLEKMKKPWFEWMCDREDLAANLRRSEDFEFCTKAGAAGFKVIVDTSIQCKHLGFGKAEVGGKFSPIGV
jgi:hypothetical protein